MGFWKERDIIYAEDMWTDRRHVDVYYGVKDGCLRKIEVPAGRYNRLWFSEYKDKIEEWLESFGYDYKAFDYKFIRNTVLDPFVDRPIEEAEENIKVLADRLRKRREKNKRLLEHWKEMDEIFDGCVVGLGKEIDVYSSGFSVRVLLSSSRSFEERRAFIKAHKVELVRWTMYQISESGKMMNAIGSLDFYRPVEIITLRNPEVEIKFQVKNVDVFDEKERGVTW